MKRHLRSLIPSILFLLIPLTAFSGWWRTYGGPSGDGGHQLEITDDGSYVVCGATLTEGGARGFLLKVGPSGDSLWIKLYKVSFGRTQFYAMSKGSDGGYIFTGYCMGDDAQFDLILFNTDSAGDSLWARQYEKPGMDFGWHIEQTFDSGFIVAGITEPLDDHNEDVWMLRFDSLGDTLWTYAYDGGDDDFGYSAVQTSDGNFVATGFGKTENGDVLYLIKLDDEGNVLWHKTYGNNSIGQSVIETPDGGLLVAGSVWDRNAVYLLKTDAAGDSVWSTRLWGFGENEGQCIHQTPDGGYILAALHNYDRDNNTADAWLVKLDANGDTVWSRVYGRPDRYDDIRCVQLTPDGSYVMTGRTDTKDPEKSYEIWLIKTDSLGLLGIEGFDNPPSVEASTVVGRGVTFSYSNLDTGFHAVVYSSAGQRISEIHNDSSSGTITWGQGQRPGVYFIRELSGTMPVRKVILIK